MHPPDSREISPDEVGDYDLIEVVTSEHAPRSSSTGHPSAFSQERLEDAVVIYWIQK